MTDSTPEVHDFLEERRQAEIVEITDWGQHFSKPKRYFRLKVQFLVTDKEVWRSITVPADFTFLDLHIVIQDCLGWLDYHLFHFQYVYRKKLKMITEKFGDDFYDDTPRYHAAEAGEICLDAVFPGATAVKYEYDYGDGWEMMICLEEEITVYGDRSVHAPACNDGLGTVPPEDVGGWGGFEMFLETINNPDDPERASMIGWGKMQGFESRFSLKKANRRIDDWQHHKAIRNQ